MRPSPVSKEGNPDVVAGIDLLSAVMALALAHGGCSPPSYHCLDWCGGGILKGLIDLKFDSGSVDTVPKAEDRLVTIPRICLFFACFDLPRV